MLQPAAMLEPPDTAVTTDAFFQPRLLPSPASLSRICNAPRDMDEARMPPPDRATPNDLLGGRVASTSSTGTEAGSGKAHDTLRTQGGVNNQAHSPAHI